MKCTVGPSRNFGYDPVQHSGWGAQSDPWDVGGAGLRFRVQLAARVSSTLTEGVFNCLCIRLLFERIDA